MPERLCTACRRPLEPSANRCGHCGCTAVSGSVTQPTGDATLRSQSGSGPLPSDLPRQLGQYRIVRELGRGGMGRVLEAVDVPLGRHVAVKILLVPSGDASITRRRFMEEARITGCLEHPGIAPVYSLGRGPEGADYFSMKLVAGRNLNDIIAARERGDAETLRQYPLARLVSIFERVVETVAYAHSQNVLHRDLKPANVMVGAHGEVWVLDWGLAKLKDQSGADSTPQNPNPQQIAPSRREPQANVPGDSDRTQAGDIVGTPQYMAPEQAKGHPLDHRTDVFGLGAILYKMLTGHSPNKGPDYMGTLMNAALGEIPPIRATAGGRAAPVELAAVAEKCLAINPEARYPSAGELLADLRAYAAGERVKAYREGQLGRMRRWARRHRRVVVLGGAALTALLVGWTVLATIIATLDRRALDAERAAQAAEAEAAARAQRRMQAFAPYAEATDLLMRGQQFDRAAQLLEDAVKFDPAFPEAQFALGEALRLSGMPSRAATEYLRANQLSQQITGKPHLQALLAAGMAHDGAGEYAESEQAFVLAEREGAGHPLALVGKSFRLAHEQRFPEARAVADEAIRKAPHLWETQFACGYVVEELVDKGYVPREPSRTQAIALLRKARELSPRQAETCVWLGRALARSGGPENRAEAIRLFDHAIALEPRNGNRYVTRGVVRVAMADLKAADSDFRRARELGAARPLLLQADALVAYHRKDYETTFRLSGELIRVSRPWPPAVGSWLAVGFQLKKDQEIRGHYDAWCKDNPHYPEMYALKAQLKARDGDLRGAVEEDRSGLKIAPYNDKLRTQLATHLGQMRSWSEALTAADAALETAPGEYNVSLLRARCLAELGRAADARDALARMRKDFPSRAKEIDDMQRSLAAKLKG